MSKEESPDLTKSWVFVDSVKKSSENVKPATSGVEDVENDASEPHVDSDTDSISVISESGCSYKTDEDDFAPATNLEPEEPTLDNPAEVEPPETEASSPETEISSPEIAEIEPVEPEVPTLLKNHGSNERRSVEKIFYFATSAACAVILIGFSVAIQQYFYESSDVNNFKAEFKQKSDYSSLPRYVQNQKNQELQMEVHAKNSYIIKRKSVSMLEEPQSKTIKLENDNNFHDKIVRPNIQIENNDLRVEDDVKSNYKPNKNKNPTAKFNKENRGDTDKRVENDKYKKKFIRNDVDEIDKKHDNSKKREKPNGEEKNRPNDETYTKKLKELKVKEDYLKEKEKFLIEKEHDLMKKEIKLNKEHHSYGKVKYEKKSYYKKEKRQKHSSEEDDSREKKNKYKPHKKYPNENSTPKNNKKYKYKEEKKQNYVQNQHRFFDDEAHKKRNISGQWYINLHKARNNIRQKEHASDWVFDRAHLRSMKRNKAHWYFQWMVDRARLRVK